MVKIYAGIGSRSISNEMYELFAKIGEALEAKKFTLRSGGADGSDSAWESKVKNLKEIYLPWKNFNGNKSPLYNIPDKAFEMAEKYYNKDWAQIKDPVKRLMARNCMQVLGQDLNAPANFIACYTENGLGYGGTGQALRIARDYGIKIFDFGLETTLKEFREFYKTL